MDPQDHEERDGSQDIQAGNVLVSRRWRCHRPDLTPRHYDKQAANGFEAPARQPESTARKIVSAPRLQVLVNNRDLLQPPPTRKIIL
jgi:hypothetical protein